MSDKDSADREQNNFVNFPIRFSRDQYNLIKSRAEIANKPTSTWIRDATLGVAGDDRDIVTLLKALVEYAEREETESAG